MAKMSEKSPYNAYIHRVWSVAFRRDTEFMRTLACIEFPHMQRILNDEVQAGWNEVMLVDMALDQQKNFIRFYCRDPRLDE